MQHGWTYITGFFIGENVERYLQPFGPNDARGVWFYLPVLLTDSFPWSIAAIGAVTTWWARRREGAGDPRRRLRTLLLLWCAVIVVFFSFSRSKQDLYIFPVAPAVASLGATFILELLGVAAMRRWFLGTFTALAILLLMLGVAAVIVFVEATPAYPVDGALGVGLVTLVGGAVVAMMAGRDARLPAVLSTVGTLIAVNWMLVARVLPGFETYKPVAPLSAAIAKQLRPDDVVAHFDVAMPSMTYYLRRHIRVTYDKEAFAEVLRSGHRVFAVLPADRYGEVRPDFVSDACVIARHRRADVKLRNILAGDPPREVVVVASPCAPS